MNNITERALLQRINRKLAKEGEQLRKQRHNSRMDWRLGDYYLVDLRMNAVLNGFTDLEALARDLGVSTEPKPSCFPFQHKLTSA